MFVWWSWWDCHQALINISHYMLLFPACDKKAYSSQIRLLHIGEHVLNDLQATETPCTQPGPRGHWASEGLHHPRHRRDLHVKKSMVPVQSEPKLGLMFHNWVLCVFPGGYFQTLVLLSCWDQHQALIALAHYMLLFPACEKKAFSSQIQLLHTREHIWNYFHATETPCRQPRAREIWTSDGVNFPRARRTLCRKNARVAFQSKSTLVLVFHHWVECTLPGGHFQMLVLGFWYHHQALIALAHYLLPFKLVKIRHIQEKSYFCTQENIFGVVYTFWGGHFQTIVFWSWLDSPHALVALDHYLLLFPNGENRAFSSQIRLLHTGELVWSDCQAS